MGGLTGTPNLSTTVVVGSAVLIARRFFQCLGQ